MVELPPIAWTAIGILVGALPSVSIAFWRECAIRRQQKHEREMQKLNYQRETAQFGMDRDYLVQFGADSASFRPSTAN